MKTVTIGFNNESQKSLNDALALMKLRMKPTHAIDELVMAKFEEVVSSLGRIDFDAESKPEVAKVSCAIFDLVKDVSYLRAQQNADRDAILRLQTRINQIGIAAIGTEQITGGKRTEANCK